MARLVKTDGTETVIEPAEGKVFSLEELQAYVGGYIEVMDLHDGRRMVMNEEGKLEGLDRNEVATLIGDLSGIAWEDSIVGDVVVCEADEID